MALVLIVPPVVELCQTAGGAGGTIEGARRGRRVGIAAGDLQADGARARIGLMFVHIPMRRLYVLLRQIFRGPEIAEIGSALLLPERRIIEQQRAVRGVVRGVAIERDGAG